MNPAISTSLATSHSEPRLPPPVADDTVTVIAPNQRAVTPCSSVVGLLREACIDDGNVWMGMVSAEPGTASVWHDHGDRTTYLLPLSGSAVVEFGSEGCERVQLEPDGSVYVIPPHLRHREVNPGATRMQAFLIRLGPRAPGVSE